MQAPDFSLITIVNKEPIYNSFKKNLATQTGVNYELIKVNNSDNQYDSARKAFNSAAKKARGKYLVFLHPDIRFLDSQALHDVLQKIIHLQNWGIAGIAGSPYELNSKGRNYIVTTLIQDKNKESVGEKIGSPVKVQTVDECFFVMKHSSWDKHPFSDIKGWHFYSVEQCLISLIAGNSNYVVPSRIWHLSPGSSENVQYIKTGKEIIRRYGQEFDRINTTVEKWDTRGIKSEIMPWINFIGHKMKQGLKQNPAVYQTCRKVKHMF